MKDIYSPLEIDEEWDNYAAMAEGGTALKERQADVSTDGPTDASGLNTEGAMATTVPVTTPDVMPDSRVMPGIDSNNSGTQESSQPDIAYTAAEALIDTPAADADLVTTPGPAATSGDTFDINDTRGLVKITPETPSTDTPQEIKPVPISVMGGATPEETPDSSSTLADTIDESTGDSKIVSAPEATPLIAPMVNEEDSGESNDDKIENSESDTTDDTDDTESDTAGSSSETKADKPEAPTDPGVDELAAIMDRWDAYDQEIINDLEKAKKEAEENLSRMEASKSDVRADLEQQIADLDEGIDNEKANIERIESSLSKLPKSKKNLI